MFSYSLMSAGLIVFALLVHYVLKESQPRKKALLATFVFLIFAMLIFNSYLTSLPIVLYNNNLTLGLKIGTIPVEDFSYLIAAVLLVPTIFNFFHRDK